MTEFVNTSAKPPVATYPGVAIYPSMILMLTHVSLQMNAAKRPTSPFLDPSVRRAFQHLVDKQSMVETVHRGLAEPAEEPIIEGVPCHESAKPTTTYPYNKTMARQIPLDAGYNSTNPINILYYSRGPWETIALYFKAAAESEEMFDREGKQFIFINMQSLILCSFSFCEMPADMYSGGWLADFPDPDNIVYPYLHADGVFAGKIGFNDTKINEWIAQAKTTPRQEACPLYQQIQERAAQLSPHIYLYQPIRLFLQRDWIQGFYPYSTNPMQYGYGFIWTMSKQSPATTTTVTAPTPILNASLLVVVVSTVVVAATCARRPTPLSRGRTRQPGCRCS